MKTGPYIKFTIFFLVFSVALGMEYFLWGPIRIAWLESFRNFLFSTFDRTDMRGLQLICLTIYLSGFIVLLNQLRKPSGVLSLGSFKSICLIGLVSAALLAYFLRPIDVDSTTDIIELFWGLVLGQGILWFKMKQPTYRQAVELQEALLSAFVSVLALYALLQPNWWQNYPYLNENRWHGLWRTPNTFGLLMATGFVLAIGLCLYQWSESRWGSKKAQYCRLIFYAFGALLVGIGLEKSYSRGSWLGTALGLIYMGSHFFGRTRLATSNSQSFACEKPMQKINTWYKTLLRNRIWAGLIVASGIVLAFWHFKNTDHLPIRRLFSVGNMNDFSWRNRIVAYEGALQMMANQPWTGYGWGWPETIYDQFYKPASLDEAKVIELNDYFTFGMTLGLPALGLFIAYLALSLMPGRLPESDGGLKDLADGKNTGRATWLKICCRAGLIVLLVGFLLDRGLFYLALTIPFWILLELGSVENGE